MKKAIIIVAVFALLLSSCSRNATDNNTDINNKDVTTVTIAVPGEEGAQENEVTQRIREEIRNSFGIEIELIVYPEATYKKGNPELNKCK